MMHFLWLLPAMLLAAWMSFAWRIKRPGTRELRDRIPPVPEPPAQPETGPEPAGAQFRLVKWISIDEFKKVLTRHSDLIVVDLRTGAPPVPFPVPAASVLPVEPKDLDAVLERLPADRSAAFCGASNLCIFMIETSGCMEGSAPLYLVEGDPDFAEAA